MCGYLIELKNLNSFVGKLCWALAQIGCYALPCQIFIVVGRSVIFYRIFHVSLNPDSCPFRALFGSCIIPVCSVAAWSGTMAVLTQLENCLPCLAVSGPPICWLQRVIGALIDAASRGCVVNVGDTACNGMVLLLR